MWVTGFWWSCNSFSKPIVDSKCLRKQNKHHNDDYSNKEVNGKQDSVKTRNINLLLLCSLVGYLAMTWNISEIPCVDKYFSLKSYQNLSFDASFADYLCPKTTKKYIY